MLPDPLHLCIPARNEADSLPRLLAALRASSLWARCPRRVVWVALNGCRDLSRQVLHDLPWQDAQLQLLDLPEAGKNRAWNRLMEALPPASAAFFLDADVVPHPDSLEKLWQALQKEPELDWVAALPRPTLAWLEHPGAYQQARVDYSDRDWVRHGSGAHFPRANCYLLRLPQALRLPEHPNLGDDLFLSLQLRGRVEAEALVYVTPPGWHDHLGQRVRQRLGVRVLKRDFPHLRLGQSARHPRLRSPGEACFWLAVVILERRAAHLASRRPLDDAYWPQVPASRPPAPASSSQPARPGSLRTRLLTPVQQAVLALARFGPVRLALQKLYVAVAELTRWWLRRLPGVLEFRVQGSLARGQVEPGLSDIDGDIILQELDPDQEAQAVPKVLRSYKFLRGFFPILQEPTLLRGSECEWSVTWGEPWSVTSRYRGQAPAPAVPNREAYLGLFLRRYLRFYTRQALAGRRSGADRYVKLHAQELASLNALLQFPAEPELRVGPIDRELTCPAHPALAELYEHFTQLRRRGFLARDHERLGPRLAALAFALLRQLAPASGPTGAAPQGFLADWLAPMLHELKGHSICLSSAGAMNFQNRLYLVVTDPLSIDEVETSWRHLREIWRRWRPSFPRLYFGVFPEPCLLPAGALQLVEFNYAGSLEPFVLATQGWRSSPDRNRLPRALRRDLAEGAMPSLRRWDSPRDRLRWLDFFAGLLPAAFLWLERGQLCLTQAQAAQAYQRAYDDQYSQILGRLPADLPFSGPHWKSDLPREAYACLRGQMDRLMNLSPGRGLVAE